MGLWESEEGGGEAAGKGPGGKGPNELESDGTCLGHRPAFRPGKFLLQRQSPSGWGMACVSGREAVDWVWAWAFAYIGI